GFDQLGEVALRLGRHVVHVARVGDGLLDRRLRGGGVQVNQFLHVLGVQQSLGVGDAVFEHRLGGVEGQGRQALESCELAVGEADQGFDASFVVCNDLFRGYVHVNLSLGCL